jgi:hypothetical protein
MYAWKACEFCPKPPPNRPCPPFGSFERHAWIA